MTDHPPFLRVNVARGTPEAAPWPYPWWGSAGWLNPLLITFGALGSGKSTSSVAGGEGR